MGNPVVHFEITGADPDGLRGYYGSLFGWEFAVGGSTVPAVSEPGSYGFVEAAAGGIPGGIGGGSGHAPGVVFYVGVPDVSAALARAEELGGTRRMGPSRAAGRDLVVAQFTDPEGNLIGLAGPA
jgi:predicted enzyme related to lactoylglutathione lyase